MKKILLAIALSLSGLYSVAAQSAPAKLLLVEVSTGNSSSASAEFIELYNPNNEEVKLDDYKLEYKSAEGANWTTKASLSGKIAVRGRLLLATSTMAIPGAKTVSSGLPVAGGHLRISKSEQVLDTLGWGTADSPENIAALAHDTDQSIKRRFDEDGKVIDTDNNFEDFFISNSPTPSFDLSAKVTATGVSGGSNDSSQNSPNPTTTSSTKTTTKTYPKVTLSELLIDPESPLTDKEDEFIELYNPGVEVVDLTGYEIQSGSTSWRYKYKIESGQIKPKGWLAINSSDSGVTLSNGGSNVRLIDPNGTELDGVSYEKAKSGLVLAKFDSGWKWSDQPTPNAKNTLITSDNSVDETSSDNKSESFDTSGFTKVAGANSVKSSSEQSANSFNQSQPQESSIDTSVLVIVGGLAVLYGLYEYRQDIRGAVAKLRRYAKNRRGIRKAT